MLTPEEIKQSFESWRAVRFPDLTMFSVQDLEQAFRAGAHALSTAILTAILERSRRLEEDVQQDGG